MASAASYAEETSTKRLPTAVQLYTDAVWESKCLAPHERLICLCYADHARETGRPVDRAWVTTARLVERTGMSKGAAIQARNGAISKGWLTDIGARPGHKQIRVYRLQAPDESAASSSPAVPRGRDGKGRFAREPVHGMDWSAETSQSAAGAGAEVNMQVNAADEQTGPPHEPVHGMDADQSTTRTGTGPQAGPDSPTDSLSHSPPGASVPEGKTEEREDHQGEDPTPPPTVPGVSADLAKRVMSETTATAEEFVRIVEDARRDGIRTPAPWLRSDAGAENFLERLTALRAAPSAARSGPPDVGDYQAAVRAACEHGTPGGSARCPLCRRQAPAQPHPAESQDPAPATPRDLTALRETLGSLTTRSGPRRPALDIQPRTAPETPPEVAAAHATLARHGRAFDLMTAARKKLGNQAHRDEVVVLAAEVAREERPAQAFV